MAKLLRVRDKILLGLSILGEVFDEVRTGGGIAGQAYENMYGFVPGRYKKTNYFATVNRMLSSDLIEKVIDKGEPKIRLSSIGRKKLVRDFPLIVLQNRRWDKKWRILIFDIPEKIRWKRDVFREKLKSSGFGMIQQSVWVSPHPFEDDIRDFIEAHNLDSFAYLFISEANFVGDIEEFVENVWKIEDLNEEYWQITNVLSEGKVKIKDVTEVYFNLLLKDPFLPRELLPDPWYADEARLLIKKIAKEKV